MKNLIYLLCALCMASMSSSAFASEITPSASASNMVQTLVGSGITLSNPTCTGSTTASGYFSGGLIAGTGFKSGIVLTSGFVSNLNGTSNPSNSIAGSDDLGGDGDINPFISGPTFKDTAPAFDFAPTGEVPLIPGPPAPVFGSGPKKGLDSGNSSGSSTGGSGGYGSGPGGFPDSGPFSDENPINPVPEPATLILLGTGLTGLAAYRKKIRK